MIIKGIDILNFRDKYRLSQGEFANLIGVHLRTVQNYESGAKIPESKHAILRKVFDTYNNEINEPETTYQEDLAEYNHELKQYEAKTIDELRDIAYRFIANESKLYEHNLLPDNREMHFWLRYKEIIDVHGSIDNFLSKEV